MYLVIWTVIYLEELFQAFNMLGSHMEFPWRILNAVQTCQYGRYGVLLSSF